MKNIHFNIDICVNEDDWGYRDPRGHADVRVTIPAIMFTEKSFSALIIELVEEAKSKFEQAVELAKIEAQSAEEITEEKE